MKKETKILENITPKSMNCAIVGCPAIYKAENDSYVVIGKLVSKSVTKELKGAISSGEIAIEIPKKLLSNINK